MNKADLQKISILAASVALTIAIHYGWILEPIFGHSSLCHAIHSRLCYIPIVMAASWYGLRGGLLTALVISILIQPFIFILKNPHVDVTSELVEIVFYFALAALTGGLIDRESKIRRDQEETQLQLERSHELSLVGQMAAGVAHEIKNPLASIKGAVEIVGNDKTSPDERKEFQGIIVKEIKRIDGTVQEFLEFARPKEVKFQRVNLGDIINSAGKQLQGQIEKAGQHLHLTTEENVFVKADPEKLREVILNLILNAIDASKIEQDINVVARAIRQKAELIVEDFGVGMSDGEKEKLFDPFFTTKSKGVGLGLAIVKSIIEKHSGNIIVESALDKGTKFIISLPLEGETK